MVELHITYKGDLRSCVRHGPSGIEIETDAPPDNQGRGERFSPTDLVAAAAASCLLTIMDIRARRRNIAIEGASARVEKHMVSEPVRRIGRIVVIVDMPAGIPAAERPGLEASGRACPVLRSLSPDVSVEVAIRYPD